MARPGRGNKTTPQKKKRLLEIYAKTGIVSHSCKLAGVGRKTFYEWLQNDPVFAEQAKHSEDEATERLEKEALRRGVEGILEPVYYAGKKVGNIRRYSDALLIFTLKARNPKKYRENVSITIEKEMEAVLDRLQQSLPKEIYAQVLKTLADSEDRT